MTDRHSTFFEVRDALSRPGCAICRLAARSARRFLESLSFESVNDLGLRAELRRARGFCNLHAWMLLDEVRDPFGAGIIARDVLHAARLALEAGDIDGLIGRSGCIVCRARDGAASRYADSLVDHAGDPEIGRLVEQAGGICWRHLQLALGRGGRAAQPLARAQRLALERMADPAWRPGAPPSARVLTSAVRAGNAAARPSVDDEIGDPVVVVMVGLRGVHGLAPAATADRPAECAACAAGQGIQARAVEPSDDGALCAVHAWRLVDRGSASAVRIALEPARRQLVDRLADASDLLHASRPLAIGPMTVALPRARRARGELSQRLTPPSRCAICDERDRAAQEVAASTDDILCRRHFATSGQAPRSARDATLGHWRLLLSDLDEYIRKNDYRFRDEPRGQEQRSPWRATEAVAGAAGLY